MSCADVLIHVCDRSSPVWKKQRETVLRELEAIGCRETPIIELWNKIDILPNPDDVMIEAACLPIDVEMVVSGPGGGSSSDSSIDSDIDRVRDSIIPVDGSGLERSEDADGNSWDEQEEYVRGAVETLSVTPGNSISS